MLFRSRRSASGTGGLSPRHATSAAYERPSSAPVAGVVPLQTSSTAPLLSGGGALGSVEDRLRIVKRNRTRDDDLTRSPPSPRAAESLSAASGPTPSDVSVSASMGPGVVPPVSAYPTFDTSRLPKHEQHVMDALVHEFIGVFFFPPPEGANAKGVK